MKVSELLKIFDWDVKIEKNLTDTKADFKIFIDYKHPNYEAKQKYSIELQFHSSYSNCGLIYVDLITNLMADWQVYIMSNTNKTKYNKLTIKQIEEFKILTCKYLLKKCWLEKSFGGKNLLFVHCKQAYGNDIYQFLPIFKGLVANSYITPKNNNSGNLQIHGVIDMNSYITDDNVPQYLVDIFKDAG